MDLWTDMRRVLSLFAGYDPPSDAVGSPIMETVIDAVLQETVPGLGRAEVLIMCQDVGATKLMRHILEHMWRTGNGKRLRE